MFNFYKRPLNQDQKQKIIELYLTGLGFRKIAKQLKK